MVEPRPHTFIPFLYILDRFQGFILIPERCDCVDCCGLRGLVVGCVGCVCLISGPEGVFATVVHIQETIVVYVFFINV